MGVPGGTTSAPGPMFAHQTGPGLELMRLGGEEKKNVTRIGQRDRQAGGKGLPQSKTLHCAEGSRMEAETDKSSRLQIGSPKIRPANLSQLSFLQP